MININVIAQRAKVSRKTIYKHHDLLARIRAHTRTATAIPASASGGDNAIVAALRAQLTHKEAEIRSLNATLRERDSTIARLYGRLDSRM
ncbi:hypothetical protein [Speluncibacter jeojiensis]|uniref:hypothetical protein n=1 Tax=Speluncibacter jeojiensis TaxID=2710754 RepID=UPI00240FA891|nr:hypothetical protein [Rhodococcus sp. D2-41]